MTIWDKPPVRETVSRPSRNILGAGHPERRRPRFFGFFRSGRFYLGVLSVAIGLVVWSILDEESASGIDVAAYVPAPSVEAGRVLYASEAALAGRFGEPLHMGAEGFPVIRHHATGEVREITPFEVAWDDPRRVRSVGMIDIMEAPGPRGWGLRWRDTSERELLSSHSSFPRHSWRARQEEELALAVSHTVDALFVALSWDVGYAHIGKAAAVRESLAQLEAAHPVVGTSAGWAAVPGQWRCDPAWESDLHQGVTPGCPTEAYLLLLSESWASVGLLVDHVHSMARILQVMEGMSFRELELSGLYPELQAVVVDAQSAAERLVGALVVLRARSLAEELPIHIDVPAAP